MSTRRKHVLVDGQSWCRDRGRGRCPLTCWARRPGKGNWRGSGRVTGTPLAIPAGQVTGALPQGVYNPTGLGAGFEVRRGDTFQVHARAHTHARTASHTHPPIHAHTHTRSHIHTQTHTRARAHARTHCCAHCRADFLIIFALMFFFALIFALLVRVHGFILPRRFIYFFMLRGVPST